MGERAQRLRGALIGYGFIGELGHLPAYRQRAQSKGDVEIAAVADICAARRELARQALPSARIYETAEALLATEKHLDFLDVATPPCDHAAIARAGLERGLHVLCEKPLAPTIEEAALLLCIARERRRVIFPGHNYKHAPVVKAIRELLASGRIGVVRSVTLSTFRNTHARGVTEWKTHWRRERRYSGGGIAMDHGSHSFYLTFDWMGAFPTAVTAKMSNLEPATYDTEDNFSAVLTFPSGLAHAHLTWTAGVRKVLYTLQGTKGAITVDDDDLQLAVMRSTPGPEVGRGAVTWEVERRAISSHWMDASHATWFNALFDQFRECIANDDYVGREAIEAYRCVEIITTAYRSARDGCRELPLGAPMPEGISGG